MCVHGEFRVSDPVFLLRACELTGDRVCFDWNHQVIHDVFPSLRSVLAHVKGEDVIGFLLGGMLYTMNTHVLPNEMFEFGG